MGWALTAAAADWPRYQGPNGDSHSPETGISKDWNAKPPKELWRISLTDKGYAGPSVAAGKLYIVDHKGAEDVVRAVDVATGKDVWSFPYADVAKDNFGFARATPTFDAGKLYTFSRPGVVHCLDAEKGTKVWSRDVKAECGGTPGQWDYAGSVVIDGDRAIVVPGGAKGLVLVLEKATGKTIWQGGGNDKAGYATPVIATVAGRKQYVIFSGFAALGVDAAQGGAPLWRYEWKTSYDVNAATPLVIGNTVFISSNYDHGCAMLAVGAGGVQKMWENKELQCHFNSPLLYKDHIYGISNKLACLDPKTGKALWAKDGFEKGGLIGIDGVLIAINGMAGDVVMAEMAPAAYKELGRIKPLGGQSWTAPIVADGKLYVRNKQALVCLDLK
jgi:outer membrane protein assembly factor BamB